MSNLELIASQNTLAMTGADVLAMTDTDTLAMTVTGIACIEANTKLKWEAEDVGK